jgi:MFS family permease
VLVCVARFMVVLDATVLNVALPSIQADLGLSNSSGAGQASALVDGFPAAPAIGAGLMLLGVVLAAGPVRGDLEPEDVLVLISAPGQSSPCRFAMPDLWRRNLGVVLDGMRPAAACPLAPPAPMMEEVEVALAAAAAGAMAARAQ